MNKRSADHLALALALIAFAASAVLSFCVFDRIPHLEDEYALLWQAEIMADGRISLPTPAFASSFMIPFVIDAQGQRFGKYPPGWPGALSIGARVGAPWMVQAVLSSLSVWLIYRLGQKLASSRVGLIAAGLSVLSPIFLMQSSTLLAHMFTLFLSLVFLHAWLDLFILADTPSVPEGLLAVVGGSSMGLLGITRPWTAIAVALPAFLHGLFLLCRGTDRQRKHILLIGFIAAGIGALLFVWQAALTGDPLQDGYTLWWAYDRLGFGPEHGPLESGHTLAVGWANTSFSLMTGTHDLFGWPYLSWLFLPAGFWALRRKPAAWFAFAVFPALVLLYLGYWTGAWLLGPRYYFEGLPGLAVVSAAGIDWLLRRAGTSSRPALARLGIIGLFVLLVSGNVVWYLPSRLTGLVNLYGITRETIDRFRDPELEPGLIIVHSSRWMPYANLTLLGYPFSDRNLDVALNQGREVDAALAAGYHQNGESVYHYYTDRPDALLQEMINEDTGEMEE